MALPSSLEELLNHFIKLKPKWDIPFSVLRDDNFEDLFKEKCNQICQIFRKSCVSPTREYYAHPKTTFELEYLELNFHILRQINYHLDSTEMAMLSIAQTKHLRDGIQSLIKIGILKNIQSNLPLYETIAENLNDFSYTYNILKFSTMAFVNLLNMPQLKPLIEPNFLPSILVSLYQLSYSPLKKPKDLSRNDAGCTAELYDTLVQEQATFQTILLDFVRKLHPFVHLKSTMVLYNLNCPKWLRQKLTQVMDRSIQSPKGIQTLAAVMYDGVSNDVSKTWRATDIIVKIAVNQCNRPNFETNICVQVIDLLKVARDCGRIGTALEQVVVRFFIEMSKVKPDAIKGINLPTTILNQIDNDTDKDVTVRLQQALRLIFLLIREDCINGSLNLTRTSAKEEKQVKLLFMLFCLLYKASNDSLRQTYNELKDILQHYVTVLPTDQFYNLLFDDVNTPHFRLDFDRIIRVTKEEADEVDPNLILKILKINDKMCLLEYLLNHIHIKVTEPDDLKNTAKRVQTFFSMLFHLLMHGDVIAKISGNPSMIITFIQNAVKDAISKKLHKSDLDPNDILIELIDVTYVLIKEANSISSTKYIVLKDDITAMATETDSTDLKESCNDLLKLFKENACTKLPENELKSELQLALQDCHDPQLPVRGHALLTLAKLLEARNSEALEHDTYLLYLFQLYLEDDDSYIYLNSIRGLVALGKECPAKVIQILCDKYSDYCPREGVDASFVRLKIGEALVKVTKQLDSEVLAFKSTLLNTFLAGTKDDDNLLRASALSNLGEVCRVLGPKVGTIMSEIIACVSAVVRTDAAPEPRRAACGVLRDIFVGCGVDVFRLLGDDLHQLGPTLKGLYLEDGDEVVKLQAQLALEELQGCLDQQASIQ